VGTLGATSLVGALRAFAGTQGRATGKVVDSAGAPLEGVAVTITTPSIRNFKLNVTTKKDGSYGFIVNDATILYDVKFEKEGYAPLELGKQKFSTVEITTVPVQKMLKPSEAGAAAGRPGQAAPPAPPSPEPATLPPNPPPDALNARDQTT